MKLSLAILLVALITGAFGLNAISRNVPYNGTFSITILPGKYHYLPLYIVGEGRLSFDFLETRSQLVSFYFLTEQQYDSYKSTGIYCRSLLDYERGLLDLCHANSCHGKLL